MGVRKFFGEMFKPSPQELEKNNYIEAEKPRIAIKEHDEDMPDVLKEAAAIEKESSQTEEKIASKETILESREVESSGALNGGSNKVEFVSLKDDGSAIFKPKDGEVPLDREAEQGTYFKRERAAYLVSHFLNFDIVPPTVIREINGKIGSAQEYIADAKLGHRLEHDNDYNEKIAAGLKKMWIFDYLIFNSDRHSGNFLYKDNQVFAIDNGLSFCEKDRPIFGSRHFDEKIPEEVSEKINGFLYDTFRQEMLAELLRELISQEEIENFMARTKYIGKLLSEKGTVSVDDLLQKSGLNYRHHP